MACEEGEDRTSQNSSSDIVVSTARGSVSAGGGARATRDSFVCLVCCCMNRTGSKTLKKRQKNYVHIVAYKYRHSMLVAGGVVYIAFC